MKQMMAIAGLVLIFSTSFASGVSSSAKACPSQTDVQSTLLDAAASDDLAALTKLRACPGADINAAGNTMKGYGTPLALAIVNKANQVFQYLLNDSAVEINKGDNTSSTLEVAINEGWAQRLSDSYLEKIVSALNMRSDFDPNIHLVNSVGTGHAPLLVAAEAGLAKTIKALLSNPKTNINARTVVDFNTEGKGVIAKALTTKKTCEIIATVLNDSRIDLNKINQSENGIKDSGYLYTNIRVSRAGSVRNCKLKLLKTVFLDTRFDVNQKQGKDEWTDLMQLAFDGADELLSVMLSRADLNANLCSKSGKSALDFAVENNQTNTVKLLTSYGAKSCLP